MKNFKEIFCDEIIKIPNMIMIGADGRNVGKTEFACSLIRKFASNHNMIGIKVTTIEQRNENCPRGGKGCGVCSAIKDDYYITEEVDRQSQKDTCRMLVSGAKKVFWLRVMKSHLKQGINALLSMIDKDAVLVCESNSLRIVVEPGLFFMFKRVGSNKVKSSAANVEKHADRKVYFDGRNFDFSLSDINIIDGRWTEKMKGTAIIMAGGRSRRMGQDKTILKINGVPAIRYVFSQLEYHFDQILISSNNIAGHSFIGAELVKDELEDKGPLIGIASGLRNSRNDINFIIACDIPEIDISLVRKLVDKSRGYDAVVPQTGPSKYEPLFAVYRKSVLAAIDESIISGNFKILDPLKKCNVNYVKLPHTEQLKNLNTMNDYLQFVEEKSSVAV